MQQLEEGYERLFQGKYNVVDVSTIGWMLLYENRS